jgi:hypothetical protein
MSRLGPARTVVATAYTTFVATIRELGHDAMIDTPAGQSENQPAAHT